MNWIERKKIGEELLNNMDLTKEQYVELCKLADQLDLEYIGGHSDEEDI